jgi:hypothetical protein
MYVCNKDYKCKSCKTYHKAANKYSCCKWYMDNVVCGNKDVKDCTEYKYKKGT